MAVRTARLGLLITLGALAIVLQAHGQPPSTGDGNTDRAAALALFKQGRALMKDENYEQACAKFTASLKLLDGVGTRFNLAECQEKTGRIASAWVNYVQVASLTGRAGQQDRADKAKARADALEPRLPRLKITVTDPVPALQVFRNGALVPAEQWGTAVPADLGQHLIEAKAPKYEPHSQTIDVQTEAKTVSVTIPLLQLAPEPPPPPPTATTTPTTTGPPPSDADPLVGFYVSVAVTGALALATGIVGGLALSTGSDYDDAIEQRDMPEAQSLLDRGRTLNIATDVLLGSTALAAGVSVVLFFVLPADEPSAEDQSSAWTIAPLIGPQATGAVGTVRF